MEIGTGKQEEAQVKPPFTKEQFFRAWMDSSDMKGWARFVGNIQKHAKDAGVKEPTDISVNMRLHKYTKEILEIGGRAPDRPDRPSKTKKVESKVDFWKRMGISVTTKSI